MTTPKKAAKQIIENLPDHASWADILYQLYVRRKIEEGLADIDAGHTIPVEDLIKEFSLKT